MARRWETVQAAIKTKLETVSTVKNVRSGWERVIDPVVVDEYYYVPSDTDATERRLHTWIVAYNGVIPTRRPHDLTTYFLEYRFEVHGFLNFIEPNASDIELRNIVDDILDVFVPGVSLGLDANATAAVTQHDINVDQFDIESFSDVICSHVKITIRAHVFVGGVHYT